MNEEKTTTTPESDERAAISALSASPGSGFTLGFELSKGGGWVLLISWVALCSFDQWEKSGLQENALIAAVAVLVAYGRFAVRPITQNTQDQV